MELRIKNTKFLFLYRSFLFRNVKFKTNQKFMITIVNALNKHKRIERIEYVYDEAVKYINLYYSTDLCKFENDKCIAQRIGNNDNINGCCRNCKYLGNKGCSSVNLTCKLIYCKTALGNIKRLRLRDIPILKCLSLSQRMILKASFFNSRENIIKELNYGLIYSMYCFIKGK